MKALFNTLLLSVLAASPITASAVASATQDAPLDNGVAELTTQTALSVSALDLSLFGVISLGVLGLFWIRRHTSEL